MAKWTEEHAEQAFAIWAVLAQAAKNRQTLTYQDGLSAFVGGFHRNHRKPLGIIKCYCREHRPKLPALTVLVVNKNTGVPESGLDGVKNFNTEREKVFDHAQKKGWKNPGLAAFQAMARDYDE